MPLAEAEQAVLSTEQQSKLTALAKKFDLKHLLALGSQQNGLPADQKSMLMEARSNQRLQDV